MNWVHKIGYYELNKKKKIANDWIIILDESVQLGQEKVLVIFGIRKKDIDFSRPLQFHDLVALRIIAKPTWNGEKIRNILVELEHELGTIIYAVGDYGSDIRKGLELAGIVHIHDITHRIALIVEKLYKTDTEYLLVTQKMSDMRVKYAQSKLSYLIPPKQRKKSRYQNIKTISDWCTKALAIVENKKALYQQNDEQYAALQWLLEHTSFILDLSRINDVICKIEQLIKCNGLCHYSEKMCLLQLAQLKGSFGLQLREKLQSYFIETKKLIPTAKKILVTSDIIESAFGKYKNYVTLNPMAGITNLVLSIAAFTSRLNENEIKKALEKTTINDIKKWTRTFVGQTITQKRRIAFAKGTKISGETIL